VNCPMKLAWSVLLIPLGVICAHPAIAEVLATSQENQQEITSLALGTPAELPPTVFAVGETPLNVSEREAAIADPIADPIAVASEPLEVAAPIAFDPEPMALIAREPDLIVDSEPEPPDPTVAEETETEGETLNFPDKAPSTSGEMGFGRLQFTPEQAARNALLMRGDRAIQSGDTLTAVSLYQEAKTPFSLEGEGSALPPTPLNDPAQLAPNAAVFWRHHQEGVASNLNSKIFGPLDLLIETQPEFIPAYLSYAEQLQVRNQNERALEILTQAASRYPNQPDLITTTIAAQSEANQWLEASLLARQFALLNPEHPEAAAFNFKADELFDRYERRLRGQIRGNAIANILTGIAGFALFGNIFGPISAVETAIMMLEGEERIGTRIADRVKEAAPMVEDEILLSYVNEMGQQLARTTGRDQFAYEFNIIMDDSLNAFALPGGKIFINAGAIVETNSEAELARLLAHEIAHSALSHGFQLVTRGQFTANLAQYVPFGGLATNLLVFGYSRGMEREADRFGTRMLATSGYAADGVRNLMQTLADQKKRSGPPAWLSTHPDTSDRVQYLEGYILENGFNRYNFEGIERHTRMRERAQELINIYRRSADYQERRRRRL